MNCSKVTRRLGAYWDDLLEEAEYREMSDHLSSCDPCASYAAATGALSQQLKDLGRVIVPAELLAAVLSKAGKKQESSPEEPKADG